MKSSLPRKRTIRILTLLGALILVLALGYAGARHIAWPWFKTWREEHANNIARDYIAKGDYANALVAARKTLTYNQRNTEAWKLAVEITEKQNSPQVIYYQQRLTALHPTLENKLEFYRLALQYHAYTFAIGSLSAPPTGDDVTKSPEYYDLAATISQRIGNNAKAKYYLISLIALQPDNNKAKLDLAQIRLTDNTENEKPAIRTEIQSLSTDPVLRTRALDILLADAIDTQNATTALALADKLNLAPDATLVTKLLIADTFHNYAPERAAPYLAQLEQSADTTDKVIPLATYMITHKQAPEARRWLDTLPDALRATEPIQVAYAYALITQNDYPALENYLRPIKWVDNEFLRQAYLARCHEKNHNDQRATDDAWKLALIETDNTPRKLQYLLNQAITWNWTEQKYDVLGKQFTLDPSDKNLRAQLVAYEMSKGDTPALNRIFARISEYDPADNDARNYTTYTNLLLNINPDHTHRAAADLYHIAPANPFYATTYALSLYSQNQPADALRVMDAMDALALAVPERALLHGLLLINTGHLEDGLEQITRISLAGLLPEERLLYTNATPIIAKARREQANNKRLATLTATTNPAASTLNPNTDATIRKSWLMPLPPSYRNNPTLQMELADNLYAIDDYASLADTLRNDPWPRNDFLRQALLAYAQRHLHRDTEADDTWRYTLISAGSNTTNLDILKDLCERWNWLPEHAEILNHLIQRDPQNQKNFDDLAAYYTQNGQTPELARIYTLRMDAGETDSTIKIRLAYYNLLTGTNIARAHVLAQEAYNTTPANPAAIKVYAYSLFKQSRPADSWRIIATLPDHAETGHAQLSLLKAIIAAGQNDAQQARTQLTAFDSKTALPEEIAMAEALAQKLNATVGNMNTPASSLTTVYSGNVRTEK